MNTIKTDDARSVLYEAAGSIEVLASALAELDSATFPGGYSACYAIKRLIDQAADLIDEAEAEDGK